MTRSTIPGGAEELDARVQATVEYCWERSTHYRDRLRAAGAEPGDVRSAAELERLPVLLTKRDEVELQGHSIADLGHPFGEHLCAPLQDVVGVASTSGTTGDPIYYAFTREDIAVTDALWATAFRLGGVGPGDSVAHAFGLSMFLAGVPVVRALERMGARPIPVGAEAGSERLLRVIRQVRPKAICCTPSYAEHLLERADLSDAGIEHVFCAGETGAGLPAVRARLSDGFGGASVTDIVGGAHGVLNVSCAAHAGMHVLGGEHSLQQLVDVETSTPVAVSHGAVGERVKTTLGWHAQPQLRASVGDVYEVLTDPCACGRPEPRVHVVGRTDDLLIVKGVKLYPAAVQNVVHELCPRLTGAFRIVLPAPGPKVRPPLRMRVEVAGDPHEDDGAIADLRRRMHDRYAVTPEIEPVPAGSLARAAHKTRFVEIER